MSVYEVTARVVTITEEQFGKSRNVSRKTLAWFLSKEKADEFIKGEKEGCSAFAIMEHKATITPDGFVFT